MKPFDFQSRPIPQSKNQTEDGQKFVHLAPTGDADETGIYREALNYATSREEVLNIALTGPYGSGKSSVIKSFLRTYEGKALQLSLASFLPDGEGGVTVTKQEIERSILQQLLYGADADRLPLSRFKRIQMPSKRSAWDSLLVSIGLACTYYLFTNQSDVMSGKFFKPLELSNWFNYVSFVVALFFCWTVVHTVYMKSLGLSLKSVSLKDIQITPDSANTESILNRHLDEIIYFFQSTNYDLVVIEDLDRFNDPDIFVTLREINGLINSNAGVRRRIRFLYALRDDIFVNTDRTKFFEFIVPVIPVINHSNSIDKVLEHGHRIKLDKLNPQFIRDVSRHLSDLRLINNIFNEYVVYSRNLESDDGPILNPDKLLAILVYKNVIPKDFAALHRQEGALSQILSRYDDYVLQIEQRIKAELSSIEKQLAIGATQTLQDHAELRKVYAMGFVERVPAPFTILNANGRSVSFSQLAGEEEIEFALSLKGNTLVSNVHGHQQRINLESVEVAVDPTRTYSERKAEIDTKSAKFKEASEKRSRALKADLASLRTRKFNEVVRENAQLVDDVFAEVGENRDLLKFLVLEGYLDDTYYQYVSLFHSGRLSPSDNKFLILIRGYNILDPDFRLDNVPEVVAAMRDEDFGQRHVLNRHIIDNLLEDLNEHATRIDAACGYLSARFEDCDDFFLSYYLRGKYVDRLVSQLLDRWSMFPTIALEGRQSALHAARILAYAPVSSLGASSFASLSRFISRETLGVLSEDVTFDIGRLKSLSVQVADIPSISSYASVVSFVAEHGLYHATFANVRYLMERVVAWQNMSDLETRHYSTLLEANDRALLRRVGSNFEAYVREVLIGLEGNTNEDLAAIVEVLNRDDVKQEIRGEFLLKQSAIFPSFDGVPAAFHVILLEQQMIAVTWENCAAFLASEASDEDVLTAYIQGAEISAILARQAVSIGDEVKPLRNFLLENNALGLDAYSSYIRQLPMAFHDFPDVDDAKTRVLIEERKIVFSVKSFEQLGNESLQVLFLASNFEDYLAKSDEFSVDDGIRKKLLNSRITDAQKVKVIASIDPALVSGDQLVAGLIGPILDRATINVSDYGADFVQAIIVHSRPEQVQISLLNKFHSVLSPAEVRSTLSGLPDPYRDIAAYGRWPRLVENGDNEQLARWLKERGLISSYTTTAFGGIRINTFKKEP